VILVGEDPASVLYVNLKEKAAAECGIAFEKHVFPEGIAESALVEAIEALNRREDVDAMIVQLPLPRHVSTDAVIGMMDPAKDADGFHPESLRRLAEGGRLPGLTEGIMRLIALPGQELDGEKALVLSNSEVFAAPLERALKDRRMQVSRIFDLSDKDYLDRLASEAKVIVTAVGIYGTITGDMVSDGAIVIDVGTTRTTEGKVAGDVLASDFEERDVWLTPVPGGVGPVTVAMLLERTVEIAVERQG